MSKKIPIAHLFDDHGRAVATTRHLEREVDRLTRENEELKRKLKSKALRARFIEDEPLNLPTRH